MAADLPDGGTDLTEGQPLQSSASPESGSATAREPTGQRISITSPNAAKIFGAQFTQPLHGGVEKGEIVLALVKAWASDAPSGEVMAKLQLKSAPYTAFAESRAIGVHPTWITLPILFTADRDIAPGTAAIVLLCGHKKQTLEVESVQVLKFPQSTDPAVFPKLKPVPRTYEGREPDAQWRRLALERIERHRKADLELTVNGKEGNPLVNIDVHIKLRRHAFGFGSAVVAKRFSGSSVDDQKYRELVDRLFSIVVFENDLKDGQWAPDLPADRRQQRNAELNTAIDWLSQRHIGIRGHYLMQVATPYNLHDIKEPADIRARVLGSVEERLRFVKNRVVEWDVINHPIAWSGADMLNKRPGLEQLDRDVFILARTLTQLPFFVNEDQVFRPGPQCDETFAYIQALQNAGLDVAGLGNQAHVHESHIPTPEHMLAVTDRFATVVQHQSITEFDIVTTEDEQLAADYTRDILIATFSHPAYTSFLLWGFWEGSHWKPEAASWTKDWHPRARGAVLEDLITKRWHTELDLTTDAEGKISWRGFPGWYEVQVGGEKRLLEAK